MVDKELIKYMVYGVTFNHSFRILDNWGEIADNLLYRNSYFNANFFPQISSQYTTQRELNNPKTGNVLRLTSSNLIFKYYVNDKFDIFYEDFKKKINNYLIPEILVKNNLIVRRTGEVFCLKLNEDKIQRFSKFFFKEEIKSITDIRISLKDTTKKGKLWRDINDYVNKIITVGDMEDIADEKYRGITYDFQVYYNPLREDIRDINSDFLEEGLKTFKEEIMAKV